MLRTRGQRRRRRGLDYGLTPGGSAPASNVDPFSRPDTVSGLGTAPNGEDWVSFGSTWGIDNGRVYKVSVEAPSGRLGNLLECNEANIHVGITHVSGALWSFVYGRSSGDLDNCFAAYGNSGGVTLLKVEAGSTQVLKFDNVPFSNGQHLGLLMVEDQVAVTVDGTIRFAVTSTYNQTETLHGFGLQYGVSTVARQDDFTFDPAILDTNVATLVFAPSYTDIAEGLTKPTTVTAKNGIGLTITAAPVTVISEDTNFLTVDTASGQTPLAINITAVAEGGPVNIVASSGVAQESMPITVTEAIGDVVDSFDRANGPVGPAESGHVPVSMPSNVTAAINANQLQITFSPTFPGMLLWDAGSANVYISAIFNPLISHASATQMVCLRVVDDTHLILVEGNAVSNIRILERNGPGAFVTKYTHSAPTPIGTKIGLRGDGDQVTLVLNDVDIFTYTSTLNQNVTTHGLGVSSADVAETNGRWNNLNIQILAPAPPEATTVEIQGGDVTDFLVDETTFRTAVVKDQYGEVMPDEVVTWSSADEDVFVVDPVTGIITATGVGGPIVLTASSGTAAPATVNVTVDAAVGTTMDLLPVSATLDPDETLQVAVTVYDQHLRVMDTPTVVYDSADDLIATVDSGGMITAKAEGVVIITADSDNASGQVEITVTLPVASWMQEVDVAAGGDGLGSVAFMFHVARDFSRDPNTNEVLSAPTSFGIDAPMTLDGNPIYDPILQAVYNPVSGVGGPRLYTDEINDLDLAEPGTILVIGVAIPANNAQFYAGIKGAAGHIGIRRTLAGEVAAQFDPAPAGSAPNVLSGVQQSDSLRAIFAKTDGGTNCEVHIPDADPVADTHTAFATGPARLVWLSITEDPAGVSSNLGVCCTICFHGALTDQQKEAVLAIVEQQWPIERATPPAGSVVHHVTAETKDLLLTMGNSFQVLATARDSADVVIPGEGFLYETGNAAIFQVDNLGNVTPVAPGSAALTIRSATDPTKVDICDVVIENAVATTVEVVPPALTVPLTQSRIAQVNVYDQAEADGVPIGFIMTAGYTVDADSNDTDVATVTVDSIFQITVDAVAQGSCVVTVEVDSNPLLTDGVAVTVPAAAVAGIYHVTDVRFFGTYPDRRLSTKLPAATGNASTSTYFWHGQQWPMSAVGVAPDTFRIMQNVVSHFTGNQDVFIAQIPIAILNANLPAMQCKIRFAARVSNSQLTLRLSPVLVVVNPNTGVVRGYAYDPDYVPGAGGLGNAFAVSTTNLVGREIAFNTNAVSGVQHGDLLMLELHAVGVASYNGFGTPRLNGVNLQGVNIPTDGWTPNTTVMQAGDAYTTTIDETFRPDWRLAADATTDGSGAVTLSMADPVNKITPDDDRIFPMWSWYIGVGGTITPSEGVNNADPSFEVEFDQTLPQPAAGAVAHIRPYAANDCVWLHVGGPTWDCSDVGVFDRDGADVSGTHPASFVSNNTGVVTVGASSGILTPVAAGRTTITISAGGRSRDFNVEVMSGTHGAAATPNFITRSWDSIATPTAAGQPLPDTNTRVAPNGSDGWDNSEASGFGASATPRCTRVTPAGVLGWYGGTGIVDALNPVNSPTMEQIQEALDAILVARSAPYAITGGRSIHRAKFNRHLGGVSPGTQQLIQGGTGSLPTLNARSLENTFWMFIHEHAMHHNIIQKLDYDWAQRTNSLGQQIGSPNIIFGLRSFTGGITTAQQVDWTTTPWRLFFRAQGFPECRTPAGTPEDPTSPVIRDDYDCTVAGEGFVPVGKWFKVRRYLQADSAPGADDGIVRVWLDMGDGRGEILVMDHTNVRLWFSDAASFKWLYMQRTHIIGGGWHPYIRRAFGIHCDQYRVGAQ